MGYIRGAEKYLKEGIKERIDNYLLEGAYGKDNRDPLQSYLISKEEAELKTKILKLIASVRKLSAEDENTIKKNKLNLDELDACFSVYTKIYNIYESEEYLANSAF